MQSSVFHLSTHVYTPVHICQSVSLGTLFSLWQHGRLQQSVDWVLGCAGLVAALHVHPDMRRCGSSHTEWHTRPGSAYLQIAPIMSMEFTVTQLWLCWISWRGHTEYFYFIIHPHMHRWYIEGTAYILQGKVISLNASKTKGKIRGMQDNQEYQENLN